MDCGEGNYAKLKQASLNSLKPSFLKPTSQIKWLVFILKFCKGVVCFPILWLIKLGALSHEMICFVFKEEEDEKTSVGEMLVERLPVFVQSADLEVQERVSSVSLTLKLLEVISM